MLCVCWMCGLQPLRHRLLWVHMAQFLRAMETWVSPVRDDNMMDLWHTDFTQSCAADWTKNFNTFPVNWLRFFNSEDRMTLFLLFILLSIQSSRSVVTGHGDVYTNHWAVRITGGPEQADRIAAKYGYINLGQVMIKLLFLLSQLAMKDFMFTL